MRLVRASSRVFALSCVLMCLGAHCAPPRPTSLSLRNESVRRIEAAAESESRGAQVLSIGDFVMESESLRVVVGGLSRATSSRGAVVSARYRDVTATEGPEHVTSRLIIGDRGVRIEFDNMFVVTREGRPALRMEGRARLGDQSLLVHRELSFGRLGTTLVASTQVTLQSERPAQVALLTRIGWAGATPWIPGQGEVRNDTPRHAPLLGAQAREMAYVFGAHQSELNVLPVFEQHGETRFLTHTDLAEHTQTLAPGARLQSRTVISFSRGSYAEAVQRWGWSRGEPFKELHAVLPYAPAGSEIALRDAHEIEWMRGKPDAQGRVALPLIDATPRQDLTLMATAFGHAPSDEIAVSADEPRDVVVEIPRGGQVRVQVRDTLGGKLIARVRIVGVQGTAALALGPDSSAIGAIDTVIARGEDVNVPVPPGNYRVLVSRGPEWSLHDERVRVTETFRPDVRATLSHQVDSEGWIACDFHLHSAGSPDSRVSFSDRVLSLVAEGVVCGVPTDHNNVSDYAPEASALGLADFRTASGAEVTTENPIWGHFNALFVPFVSGVEGHGAPVFSSVTPASLFSAVHALDADAIVQVNHPRLEGEIGYFDRAQLDTHAMQSGPDYSADFDALEVWNGFDLARETALQRVFGDWLALIARGYHYTATGNSDSHLIRYQWAGYPRNYIHVDASASPREIAQALRAGRSFVSSAPFLEVAVGQAQMGDTASAQEHTVTVHVRVRTPAWTKVDTLRMYLGEQLALEETFSMTRAPSGAQVFERDFEIETPVDAPLVVLVRGATPMNDYFARNDILPIAFSNPIWIDADGDGASVRDPRAQLK